MSEMTEESKQHIIDILCSDIDEVSMTGRAQQVLKKADIKCVADLFSYTENDLRKEVFKNNQKDQESLYEGLNELEIPKWFNALLSVDVRTMNRDELKAHLTALPDDVFNTIMSEDMQEEGGLNIQEDANLQARIGALLPRGFKEDFKDAALKKAVSEIAEALLDPNSGLDDLNDPDALRGFALKVLGRRWGLGD